MRILLAIPEHLRTVPMGVYIYETLIRLGWEVEKVDLGGRKKTDILLYPFSGGYKSLVNRRILRLARNKKPDIFFSLYGFDIYPETYKDLRQMGLLRICWWLNDPFQFEQSVIVLNIHSWYGKFNYGLNPRIFEAPACNAFTITDFKEEMTSLFDSKYVTFDTKEEMMDLLAYYLDNKEERKDISQRLHTEVSSKHTYEMRIKELFSVIEK